MDNYTRISDIVFTDTRYCMFDVNVRQIILDDWIQGLLKTVKNNQDKTKLNADLGSDWEYKPDLTRQYNKDKLTGTFCKDINAYRFSLYTKDNVLYCVSISRKQKDETDILLIQSNLPVKYYTTEFFEALTDTEYLDSVLKFAEETETTRLHDVKKIGVLLAAIKSALPAGWTVTQELPRTLHHVNVTISKENSSEVYFKLGVDLCSVKIAEILVLIEKQIAAIAALLDAANQQIPGCYIRVSSAFHEKTGESK